MKNQNSGIPVYPDENQTNFLRLLGYIFLSSEKYDKATVIFESLHFFFPDDEHITLSLAFSLFNEKRYERSYELSENIIKNNSDYETIKSARIIQAKCLWGLDRKDEAATSLKKILLEG